jgi:hypothetical protein
MLHLHLGSSVYAEPRRANTLLRVGANFSGTEDDSEKMDTSTVRREKLELELLKMRGLIPTPVEFARALLSYTSRCNNIRTCRKKNTKNETKRTCTCAAAFRTWAALGCVVRVNIAISSLALGRIRREPVRWFSVYAGDSGGGRANLRLIYKLQVL